MAVVLAAWQAPVTAHAYRTFADDPAVDAPARWASPTVAWELDVGELSGELAPADVEAAARAAFGTIAAVGCAGFVFSFIGAGARPAAAGDGRNTVSVVASRWAERGLPADRAAYTDVQIEVAADGTARIVEADFYLNFEHHVFVISDPASEELDLAAVLLHEGLHGWIGLLHPCEPGGEGGAPDCAALPEATTSAVYPTYQGARPLSADDLEGICSLYGECSPTCPTGTTCVEGLCEPDACSEPFCTVCTEDCGAPRCVADADCAVGVCGAVGPGAGYCLPAGSQGTVCTAASDCASGLCLTSSRIGRYCTIACETDARCGAGQRCGEVDGRSVCVPTSAPASCTSGRPARSFAILGSVGLAATMLLPRRRSRHV